MVLAVLIDAAVQTNQVLGQRVIFGLRPEARGRINAIYMTAIFIGGALGSTASTGAYHAGGWRAAAWPGTAVGIAMLLLLGVEALTTRRERGPIAPDRESRY